MGQKVSPKINRLGYIEDWTSKWFNLQEAPDLIEEDFAIRKHITEKLRFGAISKIVIERTGKFLRLSIYTGRPGIIIGRGGQEIENLRKEIESMTGKKTFINVMEIKNPSLDAQLVSEGIAIQLEKNISYRRAIKRSIERTMSSGALGIKVMVSGRLGGAEIARTEWLKEGRIPLHTFRADIGYGFSEAQIKKGKIGVKVWIFKRELFRKTDKDLLKEAEVVNRDAGAVAAPAGIMQGKPSAKGAGTEANAPAAGRPEVKPAAEAPVSAEKTDGQKPAEAAGTGEKEQNNKA